jgi:hypothetical protein
MIGGYIGLPIGGVLNSVQFLFPSLFTNTNIFFTPVITTGPVTLIPSLFVNTNSFFTPQINQVSYIDLFTEVNSFPDVKTVYTIYANPIVNVNTFYRPQINVNSELIRRFDPRNLRRPMINQLPIFSSGLGYY